MDAVTHMIIKAPNAIITTASASGIFRVSPIEFSISVPVSLVGDDPDNLREVTGAWEGTPVGYTS